MSPQYVYFCPHCNKNHERFRQMENRNKPFRCPDCGSATNFVQFPQDSAQPDRRANLSDVFRKV